MVQSPISGIGRSGIALLVLQAFIGLSAAGLLVWELGWQISLEIADRLERITWGLVLAALFAEAGLAWKNRRQSRLRRWIVLALLITLAAGRFGLERPLRDWMGEQVVHPRAAALGALVLVQITLVVPFALRLIGLTRMRFLNRTRPGTLFVGSFLLAILVGTLMLKTPNATAAGIGWLDALFTSASAVCVTGLIVVDTETAFTGQGQLIVLLLIQAGGLGMMTLTYFVALLVGQGINLRDRARLGELFSEENLAKMGSTVWKIVLCTFAIETIGAFLIYQAWSDDPPRPGRLAWDASFHSVSAFCNAGFSTFGDGLAEPAIATERLSQVVVMVLIVLGGLGFAVLSDLPRLALRVFGAGLDRLRFRQRLQETRRSYEARRISLHTRLVLKTSGLLLLLGAAGFFLAEGWSLSGERVWEAAFNSVTARTAGFNISDFGSYGFATVVFLCGLMFVGGSPGGTAGGVKTTTLAIALGELRRLVRGHASLHLGNRRIARDVVERSTATLVLSILWVGFAILAISLADSGLDPVDVIFECFSAFGTVGLSRGITSELSSVSKLVIVATMFVGRVGLMTLVFALFGNPVPRRYELPDARLPLN